MKKLLSLLISVYLCLCCGVFCAAESYWDVQKDYRAALESGDGDAIISCVKRIEAVYPNPSTEDEYMRLATPCEKAALQYEKKGMLREAYEYYEKSYEHYAVLYGMGQDFSAKLRCLQAMMDHLSEDNFKLFAESSEPLKETYYSEINEPVGGTYFGSCETHPGQYSAKLVYVSYFRNNIYDFAWMLPPAEQADVVEIAWNMPGEKLQDLLDVCKEENFAYLKENIDWLAGQDYRFLLRFGAEVNCWVDLNNHTKAEYTAAYKAAFRKVADYVHEAAPNVAMVYSPSERSHWDYEVTDFYPGDEYVDWVGMSTYNNYGSTASEGIGSQNDAWYCRGVYENQIERIGDIVKAFGDRKPIMISECGFCYHSTGSTQTAEHAVESLRFFYTYVNRVYPQVKAVFYFNTDFGGNHYALEGNAQVLAAYRSAVADNVAMQSTLGGEGRYYVPLEKLGKNDSLNLSAYAYFPGGDATVSYTLDGKKVYEGSEYPYSYEVTGLSEGLHRLTARAVYGGNVRERVYTLYAAADGSVSASVTSMKDISPSAWYGESVAYCMHNGIFGGVSGTAFSPEGTLTRGMLVTVLYRMEGTPDVSGTAIPFTDVASGRWYEDAIKWAYACGVVDGMSPTTFVPDGMLTREQFATVLFRYAEKVKGADVSARTSLSAYEDADAVSPWAQDAMSWANNCGYINGISSTLLSPRTGATRAQSAAVMMRFIES